ncbi:hypothetical protein RND81_06G165700 [Saponaria officinalis]|uniref:Protein kinase domain-containing protein n=1 Tax=Saponaria officinalis TaxID=3572 RepID=A0AAW1KDU3_SAPOF
MVGHGYSRSSYDNCVYFQKTSDGSFIYLLLYVDDMLIAARDKTLVNKLKAQLSSEFDMKDLGPAKKILGMEISRDRQAGKLLLSQKKYILKMIDRFNLKDCKLVNTPLAAHFKLSSEQCPQSEEGIGISMILLVALFGVFWIYKVMKRRRDIQLKAQYFKKNGGIVLKHRLSSDGKDTDKPRIFTSSELENATDKYNTNRILGHGGQGTVYKGMLCDGKIVAIKKLKLVDDNQLQDFINEVMLLCQINHRNIVKLLGGCLETESPLLVYEYVPNGTLAEHICSSSKDVLCTWEMRLQIALDIANALAYLHSSSLLPIFHRDIKASNILLDNKYKAKLSDFGISKSVAIDQTHVTTRVIGTFGYLDPEYFRSCQFTDKSDVYSFGVVVVELLTGQMANRSTKDDRGLVPWFLDHVEKSLLNDILDAQVLREAERNEIAIIAELARRCLVLDGRRRPSMKEVEGTLQTIRSSQKGLPNNEPLITSIDDEDIQVSRKYDIRFRRLHRCGTN